MAKGQKRSNREIKKPKQEKPKAATVAASTATRLNAGQARATLGKAKDSK